MHLLSFNHVLPTGGKQTQMGSGGHTRADFQVPLSHLQASRGGRRFRQSPVYPQRLPPPAPLPPGRLSRAAAAEMAERSHRSRAPKAGNFSESRPQPFPVPCPSIAARGGSGKAAADGPRQSFSGSKTGSTRSSHRPAPLVVFHPHRGFPLAGTAIQVPHLRPFPSNAAAHEQQRTRTRAAPPHLYTSP